VTKDLVSDPIVAELGESCLGNLSHQQDSLAEGVERRS
jgi:hypothetical protein